MIRRNIKKRNFKTIRLVVLPVLLVLIVIFVLINFPIGSRATSKLLNVAKSADAREVTWLIRAGANVNDDRLDGMTPLMLVATYNPNSDVMRVLIEKGADVNAVFNDASVFHDGMTPLMMAARYNSNPDILQILMDSGAVVAAKDRSGLRALDYASENEALRGTNAYGILLEKTTPILLAGEKATNELLSSAHEASVQEVTRLIQDGANADAIGKNGMTPLMQAAFGNSSPEVLRVLIENSSNVNDAVAYGRTPLMYAADNNSNPEILRVLLENGADVNAVSDNEFTALMYAARNNPNPEILRILLENGADVNTVCGYSNTSLLYAAKYNPNPETVRILIESGADAAIRNRGGDTALDCAEDNEILKETEVYELLREKTLGGE